MPYAPKRPCGHPGCPTLVDRGYCDTHKKEKRQALDSTEARKEHHAFYCSAAWRKLRKRVLQRDPICKRCNFDLSTIGAHIIARTERPDLELDEDNVEGSCKTCHDKESGQQARQKQLGAQQRQLKDEPICRAETSKWKL